MEVDEVRQARDQALLAVTALTAVIHQLQDDDRQLCKMLKTLQEGAEAQDQRYAEILKEREDHFSHTIQKVTEERFEFERQRNGAVQARDLHLERIQNLERDIREWKASCKRQEGELVDARAKLASINNQCLKETGMSFGQLIAKYTLQQRLQRAKSKKRKVGKKRKEPSKEQETKTPLPE